MSEDKGNLKDQIIDGHDYDGIQEFDNPLPGWWLTTFYLTIAFAGLYYCWYEVLGISNSDQELQEVLQEVDLKRDEKRAQALAKASKVDSEALVNDSKVVEAGKAVYMKHCVACHVADGGGLIGPNLTDNFFIHGRGSVDEIKEVVEMGGREGKGMIAWGPLLSDEELLNVSVYVKTLQGTQPVKAKAPEGNEVKN